MTSRRSTRPVRTRRSSSIKKLTAAEELAIRFATDAHSLLGTLRRGDLIRDRAIIAATEILTTGQTDEVLPPSVSAAVAEVAARVRANIVARPDLRSSYTGTQDTWAGAVRSTRTEVLVWTCEHRHSARDVDRKVRGRLVPSARTCGVRALAGFLAGTHLLP